MTSNIFQTFSEIVGSFSFSLCFQQPNVQIFSQFRSLFIFSDSDLFPSDGAARTTSWPRSPDNTRTGMFQMVSVLDPKEVCFLIEPSWRLIYYHSKPLVRSIYSCIYCRKQHYQNKDHTVISTVFNQLIKTSNLFFSMNLIIHLIFTLKRIF